MKISEHYRAHFEASAAKAQAIVNALSKAVQNGAPRAIYDSTEGKPEVIIFPSSTIDKDAATELIEEYAKELGAKTGGNKKHRRSIQTTALRRFSAASPQQQELFVANTQQSLDKLKGIPPKIQ